MAVGLEPYKPGARFGLIQADRAFVSGSGRYAEYNAVAMRVSARLNEPTSKKLSPGNLSRTDTIFNKLVMLPFWGKGDP